MEPDQFDPRHVTGPARFIGAVFGLIFFGIGLTVIGFLWTAPFGEFGSPPLFFRIVGSFISLAFVTMGGATAYAAIAGKPQKHLIRRFAGGRHESINANRELRSPMPVKDGCSCDNCGATLDSSAEVSPHGDVKCGHCDRWFNIHGR